MLRVFTSPFPQIIRNIQILTIWNFAIFFLGNIFSKTLRRLWSGTADEELMQVTNLPPIFILELDIWRIAEEIIIFLETSVSFIIIINWVHCLLSRCVGPVTGRHPGHDQIFRWRLRKHGREYQSGSWNLYNCYHLVEISRVFKYIRNVRFFKEYISFQMSKT